MIKSPRYLNASNPTRPYKHHFNVEGLYDTDVTTDCASGDELTDEQIDALINSESETVGIMGSMFDVKSDLYGDDYADAMMSELGL